MDSSVISPSRKRKNCSSSNPLINGRFTRSKSQIHVHLSRSGRSWLDSPARKPFHEAQLPVKPLGKCRNVNHPSLENGASLELPIKDLRTRARRVFSPVNVVEEKSGKIEIVLEFSENGCNGVPKVMDNCKKLDLGVADSDLGVKNSDMDSDSDSGFACSDKEENGVRENMGSFPKDADPFLDLGIKGQQDKGQYVNLNEKTPALEKKDEENELECGKGCSTIKSNGSVSLSRSVPNSFYKRKVFKAPSSFSYRRLLPYLMEMAKDEESISKFDMIDVDYPAKVHNLNNVDSYHSSALLNSNAGKRKDTDDHTKTFEHVKGQDMDYPAKNMSKIEGNVGLSGGEQTNHENGVDEMEEVVQTTPPDDTILSKLYNNNTSVTREGSSPQSGNRVLLKPSNGKSSTNVISASVKFHPSRKSNTISNAKMVLSPCSRSKIYKTSSFSYRRLLPFLTDVAKSNVSVNEPPKFQREEGDSHSVSKELVDENVPVNSIRTGDYHGNQDAEDQALFATPVIRSVRSSSDDIGANISTPFFISSDSLLSMKSISACSEALAKLDLPLLRIISVKSDSEKVEKELPNNIQSCPTEANCSSEKSCSTINQESLSKESIPDSSVMLEIELPTKNIESCPSEANCSAEKSYLTRESKTEVSLVSDISALSLDYQNDQLRLIKSFYRSSLEIEEFDHQGNQSDSPTEGILKRNPRGCRGLCSCLNCSSFRLHAERSFEFSKNQMLDAEEIARGLITELAEVRNLLEKSVSGGNDGIQINQAKEACKRSLKIEQLSKARLRQMIDDLNIHSRVGPLQRPRVTFSRYNEEITTRQTGLSTTPDLQKAER